MMLSSGQAAHNLDLAQTWSPYSLNDPILLKQISPENQNIFLQTTNQFECDIISVDAKTGFTKKQSLVTDSSKVYASLFISREEIEKSGDEDAKDLLILGCNRGNIFKFERKSE